MTLYKFDNNKNNNNNYYYYYNTCVLSYLNIPVHFARLVLFQQTYNYCTKQGGKQHG